MSGAAADLEALLAQYIDGLARRDPSAVPVSNAVRCTENAQDLPYGQGIWSGVEEIGSYRIVASDPVTSNAIYMGVLREAGALHSFAVRIHVADGQIDEVETSIGRDGHSPDGDAYLAETKHARSGLIAPPSDRPICSREELIAKVDEYYTVTGTPMGVDIDFDPESHRIENGISYTNNPNAGMAYTAESGQSLPNFAAMSFADQFRSGIWSGDSVSHLRLPIIDERRSSIVALGYYNAFGKTPFAVTRDYGIVYPDPPTEPVSLRFNEIFHVVAGRIREVESVWTLAEYPPVSAW